MLTALNWHPTVRAGLERFIRRNAGRGLPVAFDFDNTIVAGDIGEATLAVLVRQGRIAAARLDPSVSPTFRNAAGRLVTPADAPDPTAYYEALMEATVHEASDPAPFANAYVWAVECMAGLPLTEVVAATAEAFSQSVPGELRSLEVTPGRTAYPAPFFHPEIVELIACLIAQDFVPWIVSASNVWSVRWMIQHGLNPRLRELGVDRGVPPERVIGVAVQLQDRRQRRHQDCCLVREDPAYAALEPGALKPFRLTSRLQFPVPIYAGKVACLWNALRARPALAVGDSPGDHAMLSFAARRLWIARLDKPDYQEPTAELMRATGPKSWWIQSRLPVRVPMAL